MAPHKIRADSHRIPVSPLNPTTFAPFGAVIQNPSTHANQPSLSTTQANQGTATKWLDVTHMTHHYDEDSGKRKAHLSMNMFVCRPRQLEDGKIFEVGILERHPYTPQTFVPMGLVRGGGETAYLVIVAPSLPATAWREHLAPEGSGYEQQVFGSKECEIERLQIDRAQTRGSTARRPRGPPDISRLRAFVARGDQAVTYGAATWHAPMVVLGKREVEFVVVQYVNGVPEDEVQEVELSVRDGGGEVEVDVGGVVAGGGESAKL